MYKRQEHIHKNKTTPHHLKTFFFFIYLITYSSFLLTPTHNHPDISLSTSIHSIRYCFQSFYEQFITLHINEIIMNMRWKGLTVIITHSIHIQLFYSYSSLHSIHHIQSSHNQSLHLIIHSRDSNQFLSFHITINQTSILPFLNQFKLIQQTISTTYYVPSVPFV